MNTWKYTSPRGPGLHSVVDHRGSECKVARFLRLNLSAGQDYALESGALEMNVALIAGKVAAISDTFDQAMGKLDSFYVPGKSKVNISACSAAVHLWRRMLSVRGMRSLRPEATIRPWHLPERATPTSGSWLRSRRKVDAMT